MDIEFFYGYSDFFAKRGSIINKLSNITLKVISSSNNSITTIPSGDITRNKVYGEDPVYGVVKYIIVKHNSVEYIVTASDELKIDLNNITKSLDDFTFSLKQKTSMISNALQSIDVDKRIQYIHQNTRFIGANDRSCQMQQQHIFAEQIGPDSKVLELGSHIGATTITIASILGDSSNLVSIEPDQDIAKTVARNININFFKSHIETGVINIDYASIKNKYSINFDTVIGNYGYLLYSLVSNSPTIFADLTTVIVENNYNDFKQKTDIESALKRYGFARVSTYPLSCNLLRSTHSVSPDAHWCVWKKYSEQNIISTGSNTRPIYGVYFIGCIGHYLEIVTEQLTLLINSGLYEQTKNVIIFLNNKKEENTEITTLLSSYDTMGKFITVETCENLYEKFAINNYKKYIDSDEYYFYYFHTKGVTKKQNSEFATRRRIGTFYTMQKFKIILELLKQYDAVGCCTLYRYPKIHFSGNFWWSKSEHVKQLKDVGDKYLEPEMYICSRPEGMYACLSRTTNKSALDTHICLSDAEVLNNVYTDPVINEWGKRAINLC